MNDYQDQLFEDLMHLVETSEAFYFKDFVLDNTTYRIFNYRLCSYTEFLLPNALECRGHMFEVVDDQAVRLAALPPEKFFNLHENPFTMNLDMSQVDKIMLKADGSLISTYMHDSELRLKTKGSLSSDQALAAMEWLDLPEQAQLKWQLKQLTEHGFTVNMEWCAPDNRIVIGYMEPTLTILNIRHNDDGSYVKYPDRVSEDYDAIHKHWISYEAPLFTTMFIEDIPQMIDVEGYVLQMNSGQHVKIKTEWYLVQHRAKDSVNSPRRLFEAVLEETTDDLRSLFYDDPLTVKIIEEMEQKVDKLYNHLVDVVERFYERNKELERKEYAILGQEELERKYFGLAMSLYLGHDVNYKEFMKKNYKAFGIKDEVKEDD